MQLTDVTLDDKFTLQRGRIFVTGSQALARLPMLQRGLDAAAGLNTAGYISGYRGSPLGGYDMALWNARRHLEKAQIKFHPGLNEDLAATAIWGTQQVGLNGRSDYDGVFSIWYGKGPGVDRTGDVFKHGNLAGTAPHGGVLVLAGDDPMAKSSTVAHQSEPALIAASIPVFNPASIQEYVDYGLAAFALSRYAGVWVGMKCITDIVEGSASIEVDPARAVFRTPEDFALPPEGVHIRQPDWALDQERRLVRVRLPAVQAFLRANGFDRVTHDVPRRRLGIVASGKSWADLMGAFDQLGLDETTRAALGISVYKPAVVWPLEPEGARAFATGQEELLVIEEKRGLIEEQLARILYDGDARPRLVGKTDELGAPLVAADGELSVREVASILLARLSRRAEDREIVARLEAALSGSALPATTPAAPRQPWFCAGCPHNTSTRVPDGSRAFAGIGCHTMALLMPNRRTETFTQMGGEGAQWIGQAPFSKDGHVFQNLGDGTYCHSGILAIRAAVAAGVNITYKILFNDAVAMTGGQAPDKPQTPWGITRQVVAEGVSQVVVVSDEPGRYPPGTPWAEGVTIRDRGELDAVQRELRVVGGVTVLLYDQTCAAEKRRRRKRGTFPSPPRRVFINEAVCEGCGDCGVVSNCVAIKPLETAFGRKREIDQSSCNKDFSCVEGFCPSFVTVHGAEPRKPAAARAAGADALAGALRDLPEPAAAVGSDYNILVTGIGGTGVVTIGALLGMAAHLSRMGVSVLDQTGLAQKNGAVTSHVRVAATPDALHGTRIPAASADLVIGCDMVVAAGQEALALYREGRTRAVVNDHVTPLASFAIMPDQPQDARPLIDTVRRAVGRDAADFVAAGRLAEALMGDAIFTNPFLLGYACQKGLLPFGRDALERAIRLNGVSVAANLEAFGWGRVTAHAPERVLAVATPAARPAARLPEMLEEIVAHRRAHLTAYQNARYAARYEKLVRRVAEAEARVAPGHDELARAVAASYARLLAYKDEYEVARLYSLPAFRERLAATFETPQRLTVHLAPPILSRPDPATGVAGKREFGPWMFTAFRVLAKFKALRGTPFDPFGRSADRRLERRLIADYEALAERMLRELTAGNRDIFAALLSLPERIRGYGHVKERHVAEAEERRKELLAELDRKARPVLRAAESA